jgi:methionine-rich copper-binding protein CopC
MQSAAMLSRRLLLAAPALVLAARPARAHAILISSSPAQDARVRVGRVAFTLTFNARIDRARSRLTLFDAASRPTVLAILADESPAVLRADGTVPAPGAWRLRWQVLAVDGHITRGDLLFTAEAAGAS